MNYTYKTLFSDQTIDKVLEEVKVGERLLHATPRSNKQSIEANGLLIGQPQEKSMSDTNALFLSQVVEGNTGDLFRYYDSWCVVVIDTTKCPGITFYKDFFAQPEMDNRGRRNHHVMCLESIPKEAIHSVQEFD